jgi:hypothetical protein
VQILYQGTELHGVKLWAAVTLTILSSFLYIFPKDGIIPKLGMVNKYEKRH